jgi:hypothetical protein
VGARRPGLDRPRRGPGRPPDVGAVTLATVFGLFSIFYGVQALVVSAATRRIATAERRLVGSTG